MDSTRSLARLPEGPMPGRHARGHRQGARSGISWRSTGAFRDALKATWAGSADDDDADDDDEDDAHEDDFSFGFRGVVWAGAPTEGRRGPYSERRGPAAPGRKIEEGRKGRATATATVTMTSTTTMTTTTRRGGWRQPGGRARRQRRERSNTGPGVPCFASVRRWPLEARKAVESLFEFPSGRWAGR